MLPKTVAESKSISNAVGRYMVHKPAKHRFNSLMVPHISKLFHKYLTALLEYKDRKSYIGYP